MNLFPYGKTHYATKNRYIRRYIWVHVSVLTGGAKSVRENSMLITFRLKQEEL